jgi:adenosylcobinamide kinase/adenosylcobinamide-phosphate guanylyltransferase
VLGGARSGKSAYAERLAAECGEPVLYVATATAYDEEMAERIAHHRARRPASWRTIEAPTDLAHAIATESDFNTMVVEDLTLLLSNHMERHIDEAEARTVGEVERLLLLDLNLIVVSNEVGMGVVPVYPLGRAFRDSLGRVNQAAAGLCDEVYLIVAGLPLRMK